MVRKRDERLERIRELRDAAARELEKERPAKAVERYLALEALDPDDPSWAKRAADCYLKLQMRTAQVAALARAADGYARTGFLLKAVALSKLILSLDGNQQDAEQRLTRYQAQLEAGTRRPTPERPAPAPSARPSLLPGATLESVALRELVPAVADRAPPSVSVAGVYPIELGDAESGPLEAPVAGVPQDSSQRACAVARRILPRVPLFSELNPSSLNGVLARLRLSELDPREILFRAGDPADAMYIIAAGAVEVQGEDGTPVAALGEGEFFGELGIVADIPRTRTIMALEQTQLLGLDRYALADLAHAEPAFLPAILRFVRERLVSLLTATSPLFAPFSVEQRLDLVRRFRFLEAERDAVLVEEERPGPGLFILLSGEARVTLGGKVLARLESGDVFGEMSLLTRRPAMATVRVTKKAFALLMPTQSFLEAAMMHPQVLLYTSELSERRALENASSVGVERATDTRLQWA